MHDSSVQQPNSREDQPVGDADDLVTALLTASRVLVGVSARSLADVEGSVSLTQFRMLVVLERRAGTNLAGLAKSLGVNASTALRMVDRLVDARCVERHDNPGNRREVVLTLTPHGRAVVADVTARRRAEIARIVSGMATRERVGLVAALQAFAEAADEPDPATSGGSAALGW